MTRIANLASNTQLVNLLLRTQKRMQDAQVQIASEKVSQTYKGIATDAERLVNIENDTTLLNRYATNNTIADLKLSVLETTLDGIKTTIRNFRDYLFEFNGGSSSDQNRVSEIQKKAFRALQDLEAYLNTDVNGEYLFSGARTDTQPVDFNASSLSSFQGTYDGTTVLYPMTRGAHVETSLTTSALTTGAMTFSGTDTITAATAGTLSSIPVGSKITLAGSTSNDGDYTVVSNDGTNIVINGTLSFSGGSSETVANTVTNGGPDSGVTISVSNYYGGDNLSLNHRVDNNQDFEFDINAIDPAFEKAIRAMGIIAQGVYGTAGGLDQNTTRSADALNLLSLSLEPAGAATEPYGTEQSSNLSVVELDNGYKRNLITDTDMINKQLIGYFEARTAGIENVDNLDAITRLLDDSQSLEASYQALSRIRSLSLLNFL